MTWLISKAMMDACSNLHSLPALVEEYLEDTSSDGEPSAQLNWNPTQQAYLSQDRMTAFSQLSRFGMTFAPLTESRGEELLTLYLAGFPVKTLARRGGGRNHRQQIRTLERDGKDYWRGSTPLRVCGKQPNARF